MWDTALNWLAATGLFVTGMAFRNSQTALQHIRKQQRDLNQSRQYLVQNGHKQAKVQFDKIRRQNKPAKVILQVPSSNVRGLKPQTFMRTYHDFPKYAGGSSRFNPFTFLFMEGETGGEFEVKNNYQKIKVDIRECNIHHSMLERNEPQQLKLIQGKSPTYESVTYSMRTGVSLLLAGVLSYNLEQKQWILLPTFLINKQSSISSQNCLKWAFKFLEDKAGLQKFKRILSLCGFFLILALRSKQLINLGKSFCIKVSHFFRKSEEFDLQVIEEVIARQSDRLRCPCGKTLNVVFPCRHLSSCQMCYEAAYLKQCRICGADGGRVIKVFT